MVKRWALLCGGDWYASGNARGTNGQRLRKPANLTGCVKDVEIMRDLLLRYNDPDLNIRILTATTRHDSDEPLEPSVQWPTWENIRQQLRDIEKEAQTNRDQHDHLLYFHYSGHGTTRSKLKRIPIEYNMDGDDDIDDLEGTALVMTDVMLGGRYLTGRQLGFWIKRMVKKSGFRATIVLDSCYSGHGLRDDSDDTDSGGTGTPRNLDYIDDTWIDVDKLPEEDVDEDDRENDFDEFRDADEAETCWFSNPQGCTVVTACSKQKKASERLFSGSNRTQGVLTYWLWNLLSRRRSMPQLWPSHKRIVDHVRSKTRSKQTPMVFGDDRFEFFGLKIYAEGESCNATRKNSDLVKLDIGSAQGVVAGAVYDVVPADSSPNDTPPVSLVQIRVTSVVETFESCAELVSQVTFSTWPVGEKRDANLHQWALLEEVGIHFDPENLVDSGLLNDELAKRPGLVLGSGTPSGRDLVVSLHDDDTFRIRQDGESLPRLPRISKTDSSWPVDLIRVLSHVSRFQALQDLYDSSSNNSRMLQKDFTFVSDPDPIIDGDRVNLQLTYERPFESLWVSLYCFSASWGIKKIWPHSGTAAELSEESELFNKNIPMSVPPKWRESDPDEIEDTFYIFVSTSGDTQVPSWGNICLSSLRPAELMDPMQWSKTSTENETGNNDEVRDAKDLPRVPKSPQKKCHWTVLKKVVVTRQSA